MRHRGSKTIESRERYVRDFRGLSGHHKVEVTIEADAIETGSQVLECYIYLNSEKLCSTVEHRYSRSCIMVDGRPLFRCVWFYDGTLHADKPNAVAKSHLRVVARFVGLGRGCITDRTKHTTKQNCGRRRAVQGYRHDTIPVPGFEPG